MKMINKYLLCFATFLCSTFALLSQTKKDSANTAYLNYNFTKAIKLYNEALNQTTDSLEKLTIKEQLTLVQNGINMMKFCSIPVVVAKQKFSINDFFLFYPLGNKCWVPTPNVLDTIGNGSVVKAMYAPKNANSIYFSKADGGNAINLYQTHKQDSVWTYPQLLDYNLNSPAKEIFPMLSGNGKTLFFSSNGLYGVGGYDLYVSQYNENTRQWSKPVNMGFPYSSPYDDYLFVNTPDGKYSVFASNRDCAKDSVWVYVLEYDIADIRTEIDDYAKLKELMNLNPSKDLSVLDINANIVDTKYDNIELVIYNNKMEKLRELTDSLSNVFRKIDKYREEISEIADSTEQIKLINAIAYTEKQVPIIQDSLAKIRAEVQNIELKFLSNGIIIDTDFAKNNVDKEIISSNTSYTFIKNNMGSRINIKVLPPIIPIDSTLYSTELHHKNVGKHKKDDNVLYIIRLFPANGESLSAGEANIIKTETSADIIQSTDNNITSFLIGPFKNFDEVKNIVINIASKGLKTLKIEKQHKNDM